MHTRRGLMGMGIVMLTTAVATAQAPEITDSAFKGVAIVGSVKLDPRELAVEGPSATLAIGDAGTTDYQVTMEVSFITGSAATDFRFFPFQAGDLSGAAPLRVYLGRDPDGKYLSVTATQWETPTAKAKILHSQNLVYTPLQAPAVAELAKAGIQPPTWKGRWIPVRLEVGERRVAVWIEGQLVCEHAFSQSMRGPLLLTLPKGDRIRNFSIQPLKQDWRYLTVDIGPEANDRFPRPFDSPHGEAGGVPFDLPAGPRNQISLLKAAWPEAKTDPAFSYAAYDYGPAFLHDARMPFLRVPHADYLAAHLLAVAEDDPGLVPGLTVRAGSYKGHRQVAQFDFWGDVPRQSDPRSNLPAIATPAGRLFQVTVPMTEAFAQDIEGPIEIELTKQVRLARRAPDPCQFTYRPLGQPSGVRIAAITFERSPLQMTVTSQVSAHAFVEPRSPEFQVQLTNLTPNEQGYRLEATATPLDGKPVRVERNGRVAAGRSLTVMLPVRVSKRGYHDFVLTLKDAKGRTLLNRTTSFALLPPDTRKYRDRSPFGTWDFGDTHYGCADPVVNAEIQAKLGLRWVFTGDPALRKKYGLARGLEPLCVPDSKTYAAAWKDNPDLVPVGLLFHEHCVSGDQISKVPDFLTDWPAYQFSPEEQKKFDELFASAVAGAKDMRTNFPQVKLSLGNGPVTMRESLYRHQFPKELFDYAGNESAGFGRPPEAQPPDPVANNASLWMDQQLLKLHGYDDQTINQCYECVYPSTNPGNVDPRTQGDYYARHMLHALAWGIPYIRYGLIADVGNSYRLGNWGACAFAHTYPEMNVKPSFVSVATLTLVLDGARFVRQLDLGSPGAYALEFERPDGSRVYAAWTLRGQRPATFQVDAPGAWTVIDSQANERKVEPRNHQIELTLTPSPIYVAGSQRVRAGSAGAARYDDKPDGQPALLSSLASLDEWTLDPQRDPILEFYSMMTPRRKGDFAFDAVGEFEGRQGCLRVTPKPIATGKDTMPMYAALTHKKGLALPGTPTEIGLWINGNSGWGRVIFELEDATGQKWTSIGAPAAGAPPKWLDRIIPADLKARYVPFQMSDWNTEDVYGISRINFDGWRYVAFPLPGQYPGEGYHWPINSQWRWDKDGIVHYPLTLKRLIVELPEKVLHVKDFAPAPRREIYLKDLQVSQGDTVLLKKIVGEWGPVSAKD